MNSDHNSTTPSHPPRLSHMVRTPDFNGYGFNLHTIKNKTGQFIGQVDKGSPAETALLKEGDKIIEVNGVNIASENHKQVVSRIKLVPGETSLLVVDEEGETWYKEHNIVVTSDLPEVIKGTSVVRRLSTSSSEGRQEDKASLASESSAAISDASNRQEPNQATTINAAPSSDDDKNEMADNDSTKDITDSPTAEVKEVVVPSLATESGSNKSNASIASDDEDETIAKELITNDKHDEEQDATKERVEEVNLSNGKTASDSESDNETTTKENLKNEEAPSLLKQMVQENVATKRETDEDSNSSKSRSNGSRRSIASVSSASSHGSGGNSQGTDRVADKSPLSSPSPPSSVGAPSPTPVAAPPSYNRNMDGLNMNMTAVEMRELLASKKKRDIRYNTDMDLRKKYEIVQKL